MKKKFAPRFPSAAPEHLDILKPCPFCGSPNVSLDKLIDEHDYFVSCGQCEIQQLAVHTRKQAIDKWNMRAKA